ncbi:MAG: sugar ABC transporter ATP-binding protein [Bacilli bacterium]
MNEAAVVSAKDISKRYNNVTVLDNFSITIGSGEVHALIGHNGAGKSTVIRLLSGSEPPSSGTISILGEDAQLTSPSLAQKKGIFTVYQELHLIDEMTVADNIFLGRELHKRGFVDRKRMDSLAAKLLAGHHQHRVDARTKVKHLSHAKKQLIEIISALNNQAKLILLDEPTTALESEEIAILLDTIRRLTETGVSFLFITHKLDEAFAVADHVTVLRNGRTVLQAPTAAADREEVVRSVVGKELTAFAKTAVNASFTETALEIHDLRSDVLAGVNLTVHRGQVIGLYGLVGSGRTEVLETIFGVRRFAAGNMTLFGKPYQPRSPIRALRAGVRLLTEDRKRTGIIPQMDARMNMALSSLHAMQTNGFINRRKVTRATDEFVAALSIQGDMSQPVVRLSGGNQQKVLLARWLMRTGTVLLLDEPTKGVDIGVKAEIHGIIRRLAHEGYAMIVVSSEVEEIMSVADAVIVMAEGRTKDRVYDARSVTEDELLFEAMEG